MAEPVTGLSVRALRAADLPDVVRIDAAHTGERKLAANQVVVNTRIVEGSGKATAINYLLINSGGRCSWSRKHSRQHATNSTKTSVCCAETARSVIRTSSISRRTRRRRFRMAIMRPRQAC